MDEVDNEEVVEELTKIYNLPKDYDASLSNILEK